jgi:hypothetical protein
VKGWRLRWLIALAGLCACCAHATGPVVAFGHCTTAALRTAADSILGRVMTALAQGDYVDELAALAKEVGADEVGCAVDLAIAELTGKAARSNDSTVAAMLAHAQAWRGSNP